jgi:hypothetical protein
MRRCGDVSVYKALPDRREQGKDLYCLIQRGLRHGLQPEQVRCLVVWLINLLLYPPWPQWRELVRVCRALVGQYRWGLGDRAAKHYTQGDRMPRRAIWETLMPDMAGSTGILPEILDCSYRRSRLYMETVQSTFTPPPWVEVYAAAGLPLGDYLQRIRQETGRQYYQVINTLGYRPTAPVGVMVQDLEALELGDYVPSARLSRLMWQRLAAPLGVMLSDWETARKRQHQRLRRRRSGEMEKFQRSELQEHALDAEVEAALRERLAQPDPR